MRCAKVFHSPSAHEMSYNVSHKTSVISDLSFTDGNAHMQ